MNRNAKLLKDIQSLPIHEHVILQSEDVVFSDEVRFLCEKNGCGLFGTSWACPPAIGSVADCKKRCLEYTYAFMFTTVNDLKGQYDIEGWRHARKKHEQVTDSVVSVFRRYGEDFLALSTEGCAICEKCTYPNAPCKHPDRMHPAAEGYGILILEQARKNNVRYNNGKNTVTYFTMIFFNSGE